MCLVQEGVDLDPNNNSGLALKILFYSPFEIGLTSIFSFLMNLRSY